MWWCLAALAMEPGPVATELAALPAAERLVRLGELLAEAEGAEIEALSTAVQVAREADPSLPASVLEGLLRAALDADPSARAWALSQVGSTAAASAPPRVEPDPELLERYEDERLWRGTLTTTTPIVLAAPTVVPPGATVVTPTVAYVGSATTRAMVVREGSRVLKTRELAEKLGDDATLAEGRRRTRTWRAVFGSVGGAFTAATVGLIVVSAVEARSDELGAGAPAALGAVGTGTVALCTFPAAFVRSPYQTSPAVAWKGRVGELDEQLAAHNDALRQELGLTAEDVASLDEAGDDD